MKLAIVGKESIDALQKTVTNTFSGIANSGVSRPVYSTDVFDFKNDLYHVVPIKERRELRLSWLMPSCYDLTLTSPTSLLSYCLGDESKGSVLSEFALMRVTVYLTPQGLDEYKECCAIIYKYIDAMRQLTEMAIAKDAFCD
eukprot:223768_1